jgi:hypothetical protein
MGLAGSTQGAVIIHCLEVSYDNDIFETKPSTVFFLFFQISEKGKTKPQRLFRNIKKKKTNQKTY